MNIPNKYQRYKKKHALNESDRIISLDEESVYRLCHHDFGGLTTQDAAFLIGMSTRRINQLLESLEQKAPQLFPILTKKQVEIRDYINERGLNYGQIAHILGISINTIADTVTVLKRKGIRFRKRADHWKGRFDISTDDGNWQTLDEIIDDDKIVGQY